MASKIVVKDSSLIMRELPDGSTTIDQEIVSEWQDGLDTLEAAGWSLVSVVPIGTVLVAFLHKP